MSALSVTYAEVAPRWSHGPAAGSPLLVLSNLDYHDAAFLPPRVVEVDVTDAASLAKAITELEKQMKAAAKRLEFEESAAIRDRIKELRAQQIYKSELTAHSSRRTARCRSLTLWER